MYRIFNCVKNIILFCLGIKELMPLKVIAFKAKREENLPDKNNSKMNVKHY